MHKNIAEAERRVAAFRMPGVLRRSAWLFLAILMALTSMGGTVLASEGTPGGSSKGEYESTYFAEGSYAYYAAEHENVPVYNGKPIVIDATDYIDTNAAVEIYRDYFGVEKALYIPEESIDQQNVGDSETLSRADNGYVKYKVTVPQDGLYTIRVKYYPVSGRGTSIEKKLLIDGELPFKESGYISFSRVWKDSLPIGESVDSAGNEVRSTQVEMPEWRTEYLNDAHGYYYDAFLYYLKKGEHELTFVTVKESIVFGEIILDGAEKTPAYAEVLARYEALGYTDTVGQSVKIEAESPVKKSDSSVYPYYSRTSVATSSASSDKFEYSRTLLNVIGGTRWARPGQWVTWEVTVPETGLYTISVRARQNINRGMYASRALTINGQLPFEEAKEISFLYSADFEMVTLGNEDGPFKFYFEAGKTYELTLENTLGVTEDIARRVDASLSSLLTVYRRMLMLIGSTPDENRDYNFDTVMSEEVAELARQAEVLVQIADDMQAMTGQNSSEQAMLRRVARRLTKMSSRTILIAKNFAGFRSDLGAIADWMVDMNSQPLEVDYFLVSSPDKKPPKANAGFFANVGHELKLFWSSFFNDYSMVGDTGEEGETIIVWFGNSGREQAQLLKQMIDDDFTPNSGINVKLQFITMSALLPATLAGKGPDVALNILMTDPVNYAMRGAVVDMAEFDDFDEVIKRFYPASWVPFKYLDGVYALPETFTFPIMFYRTDILAEMGIEVPETWQDVYNIIPDLMNNYMGFGLMADINSFLMMFFQRGGDLYRGTGNNYGIASGLDSAEAIDAFIDFTDLYRSYSLDKTFDFQNRFRRGEMPIAISDYSNYNAISIAAPEIRGLWAFSLVPGYVTADENGETVVNRAVPATSTGSIILSKSTKQDAAWEFLKWWTSDDAQIRYATEIESIVGTAARYCSANTSVMYTQGWTMNEYRILQAQAHWAEGVPQVPGSYFTTRHIDNAWKQVITSFTGPRETLLDYIVAINQELTNKREEMGLQTLNDIPAGLID